jgi:hypothetical protein
MTGAGSSTHRIVLRYPPLNRSGKRWPRAGRTSEPQSGRISAAPYLPLVPYAFVFLTVRLAAFENRVIAQL